MFCYALYSFLQPNQTTAKWKHESRKAISESQRWLAKQGCKAKWTFPPSPHYYNWTMEHLIRQKQCGKRLVVLDEIEHELGSYNSTGWFFCMLFGVGFFFCLGLFLISFNCCYIPGCNLQLFIFQESYLDRKKHMSHLSIILTATLFWHTSQNSIAKFFQNVSLEGHHSTMALKHRKKPFVLPTMC